ncbi:RNA ligase family protein [Halohasta salina]|uniref:RNA ligase family protein n=1 Tax=Halohasta salina TaxID=2961621 RepID=UPI0020A28FB3|nr:RNA ligase family protein [Halohasta salina]
MHPFPSVPHIDDAPTELLESGHLWLLEAVAGAPLRFRLLESGLIEFGDANRVYETPDDLPPQYGHAVRHVQDTLDREALRAAVDDVEAITFFGQATQYRGVDYDWERMPSFLGTDIWAADTERFRPPDAVDGIFDRLGLDAVTPIAQEVRARDFDPASYKIPESAWYDGPAAGVVIRDKSGHRGRLPNPDVDDEPTAPDDVTAVDLADRYGSDERLARLRERLRTEGQSVTVDALLERILESALRELDPRLFETGVDRGAVRSELAGRVQRFLNDQ